MRNKFDVQLSSLNTEMIEMGNQIVKSIAMAIEESEGTDNGNE